MIVTLTANPSFDRTVALSRALERGGVTRAVSVLEQAGGKGVNISRAATAAEVATTAVFPAPEESPFVDELHHGGIACHPVTAAGPIRVNLTITEPDGTTTKINSAGAQADTGLLDRLAATVVDLAARARWVVLAGSLPPGAPDGWYAELAAALVPTPARVAVDTSDRPLVALAGRLDSARPDLMKPNAEELALLTGDDPDLLERDPDAVARAAATLVGQGAGAVLVTLGGAGAVLVDRTGAWRAEAPPITVVSTVGAGDSSLFGYVLGELRGHPAAERLQLAVAYGSAAAGLPGTTLPAPHQVDPAAVAVHPLPLPGAPEPAAGAAQHPLQPLRTTGASAGRTEEPA